MLKFYKYLKKKFSYLLVKALISKIVELSAKNSFLIVINLSTVATCRNWINDNNYVINNLLNSLTQSIQSYTNIVATIKDFIVLSRVNHACIALSQSKFVSSDLFIVINLSKYEKALYFLDKSKKAPYSSFYEDE